MVEILAFVAVYRIATIGVVLRTADLGLLYRRLLPQIEAIKKACGTDLFKANKQIGELCKKHGGNPGISCAWVLLDVIYFFVFLAIASARPTSSDGLLWVPNLKSFSLWAPLLWIGARYVQEVVHRMIVMGTVMEANVAAAIALVGGLAFIMGWYWKWPAYVFLFGMVLHAFNAIIFAVYVLTGAAGKAAGASPSAAPSPSPATGPSPTPPVTPPPHPTPHPHPTPQPYQRPQPHPTPQPYHTPQPQPYQRPQPYQPPQPQPSPRPQAVPQPSPAPARQPAPVPKPLDLAAEIDKLAPGGTFKIDPPDQHVQGPLVIRKPVTIDGQNSTIWAQRGPVVSVESDGVVLSHVSVEITGRAANLSGPAACALALGKGSNVALRDVAVRGYVEGLSAEAGPWRYPRTITLGAVKAGQRHQFKLKLVVGAPSKLVSNIAGLTLEPRKISGAEEVTVKLDALSPGTRLRGSISLETALLSRTIVVTGNVPADGSGIEAAGRIVYEPDDWEAVRKPPPPPPPPPPARPAKAAAPPARPAAAPRTPADLAATGAPVGGPRTAQGEPGPPAAPGTPAAKPSAAPGRAPKTSPAPAETKPAAGQGEPEAAAKSPTSRTLRDSVFGAPSRPAENAPPNGVADTTPQTQPPDESKDDESKDDESKEAESPGPSKRRKVIRGGGMGVFGDDAEGKP